VTTNPWLAAFTLLLVGCGSGDWTAYGPDPGALPEDSVQAVAYPSGPYGTRAGDRVANLVFQSAFFDPETLCKDPKDLDLSQTEGVQPLSLHDIYRGDPYCPDRKKQFLWLVASAGW